MSKNRTRWFEERNAQNPTKVNGQQNTRTALYRRELWKIVKSCFDCRIPDEWDLDYFLNTMLVRGYVIITDSKIGVIPMKGTLAGVNYMNLPTEAVMTAPLLGNWRGTLGVDCQIIYLERFRDRNYFNFQEVVQIFAEKLASCDRAIDVNLINSEVAYVAEAETKAQAETIKHTYDKITEGEPLVVYRKDSLSQTGGLNVFFGNVKQNYVADLVQDTKRTIINEFLTYLGINNANTDKRERLVSDEVNANNEELTAQVDIWKANLKRQVKSTKSMFPTLTTFDIKYKYGIKKEMNQNDPFERDRNMGDATSE